MELFVPGRICLFGEHSDWAGGYRRSNPDLEKGYTLITGTDQGIYAQVEPHPSALVLTSTTPKGEKIGPVHFPMQAESLLAEARSGSFWSYIAGVAYQALIHYQVRGLVIDNYKTDLPARIGLSSSAAVCVLAARAFNSLYELKLTVRGEMELAYQGEITTPSRCGRMDQGCAFGNRPVLMTFDGDCLETTELQVAGEFHYVIVDLGAGKDTLKILERLNSCFPYPNSELAHGVMDLLGPFNKRIVAQSIQALKSGDAPHLGALMQEAQVQFDSCAAPVCPEELTAPILHRVLTYPAIQDHIYGGKGIGSQGDGSAQLLARSQEDQQIAIEILQKELGMSCQALTLRPTARVRKAVIPAAGFGTRLFPATKAAKKELFPVVGPDGIARPAILYLVEEALDAGLEEVIIIVQPDDLQDFYDFFNTQIALENYNKLSVQSQEYARNILQVGQRVRFALQRNQEGFGHAVYSAHQLVGDEPFLLMLGDHLYRSNNAVSCTRQILDAYQQHATSILGLRRTPEAQITSFGTVTGDWIEQGRLLDITKFSEKPDIDYARDHLHVEGLAEGEYLTVFGTYILEPRIFEILREHIENNLREQGEFQLTTALERMRREQGFLGVVIAGQRFDIGIPSYYLETLNKFIA